jgi:DNA-binding GntR family transcriptional regulator
MTSKYALNREDLTLNARLVRGLRGAILSGDLKGGARLVEREMTEMFGVSRGLLREAIQTLASEGLITLVPHKGPVVTLLGREEAAELYRVRGALEGLACSEFTQRASDDQRQELFDIFDRLEAMMGKEDPNALVEAKNDFYRCLLTGAANNVLEQMFTQLNNRIVQLRRLTLSASGRFLDTLKEIGKVVDAIRAGDGPLAKSFAEAHVAAAAEVVERRFSELDLDKH